MDKKIQSALISVFYKDGLEPVVQQLHELDREFNVADAAAAELDFVFALAALRDALFDLAFQRFHSKAHPTVPPPRTDTPARGAHTASPSAARDVVAARRPT